jgi:hypothetical protein
LSLLSLWPDTGAARARCTTPTGVRPTRTGTIALGCYPLGFVEHERQEQLDNVVAESTVGSIKAYFNCSKA